MDSLLQMKNLLVILCLLISTIHSRQVYDRRTRPSRKTERVAKQNENIPEPKTETKTFKKADSKNNQKRDSTADVSQASQQTKTREETQQMRAETIIKESPQSVKKEPEQKKKNLETIPPISEKVEKIVDTKHIPQDKLQKDPNAITQSVVPDTKIKETPTFQTEMKVQSVENVYVKFMGLNLQVLKQVIEYIEKLIVPGMSSFKENEKGQTFLIYFFYTLVLLKIFLFFLKKKSRMGADFELIQKKQSEMLVGQFNLLRSDILKSNENLLTKTNELQKSIETMKAEKKEEEPLDFLVQNLGDLWKEIRDLKTRVNEVDIGSNLLSFNSKMEFKTNGKQEKILPDENDDDSVLKKMNNAEFENQILKNETEKITQSHKKSPKKINESEKLKRKLPFNEENIPEKTTPEENGNKSRYRENADQKLNQFELDFSNQVESSLKKPAMNTVEKPSELRSPQKNNFVENVETMEIDLQEISEKKLNSPNGMLKTQEESRNIPEKEEFLQNQEPFESKFPSALQKVSIPTNLMMPKNLKNRTPIVKALPPKIQQQGAPTSKPGDSTI